MNSPEKKHINPLAGTEKTMSKADIKELAQKIHNGDRIALSRGITLVESENKEDALFAAELIQFSLPRSGNSHRIGITGVPGAGKSTFIEYFGKYLTSQGKKVAVLAIDPSSAKHKGSILGDKTRMNELSVDPHAFIRPSPSGGTLGGVARKTRESVILCEAAGYETIIIETVGVGQSETDVQRMTDLFLLLMIPGAGDELQGIKRGIMEMADIVVVNKDDGDNTARAKKARQDISNALHLLPQEKRGWIPAVLTCSSAEKKGIDAVSASIDSFFLQAKSTGLFEKNRKNQAVEWLDSAIRSALDNDFFSHNRVREKLAETRDNVAKGLISPFSAAEMLLNLYKK